MSCCDKLLEAASKGTPCECSEAGYCTRHNMTKPAHFVNLCRTNIQYFEQYERGVGPGQVRKFSLGLGDVVAFVVKVLTLGFTSICNSCEGRKSRLNKIRLWR